MDPGSPLLHKKHIVRVGTLLVLGLLALLLGRSFFIPETYGEFGPYRAANVAEFRALPVRHGGDESCRACHEDEYDTHSGGGHAVVRCELCHGPVAFHAKADEKIADMPVNRTAALCIGCHETLAARPEGFPQVQPRQHVDENDGEFTPDVCFECHEPHAPLD